MLKRPSAGIMIFELLAVLLAVRAAQTVPDKE
jgi:hypothetical protein